MLQLLEKMNVKDSFEPNEAPVRLSRRLSFKRARAIVLHYVASGWGSASGGAVTEIIGF